MSKRFNMRNALCTLMACGATMGGVSAVSLSSTPVFAATAETVSPSGGDFQITSQSVVGKRKAKKMLSKMVEDRIMGGPSAKVVKSDDAETRGLEQALYEQTKAAAMKDCMAVNDDPKDLRALWGLFSSKNPNTNQEYSFLEDASSINAVKAGFPAVVKIATNCSGASGGLKNVKQTMSLLVRSIEDFSYAMKNADMQLKLLPNYVEYAERNVVYNKIITDSLETSIIGKSLDMSLLKNEKLRVHVQKLFDDIKKSYKERLDALKQVLADREAGVTSDSQNKKTKGKQKNNGKPAPRPKNASTKT